MRSVLAYGRLVITGARSELRKHDRELLAVRRANGVTDVMVVVASLPGANAEVARQLERLGAAVRFRQDEVDYLRVKLPIERVEEIATLSSIQALNVDDHTWRNSVEADAQDERQPPGPRTVEPTKPDVTPFSGRDLPAENPFVPTRDIGAPQFIAKNPTFDGRGATIAIVENSIDLLAPELQTAFTLDGKPTRKVVDIIDARDYSDEKDTTFGAPVGMQDRVEISNGRFSYKETAYNAAEEMEGKTLGIGFFDETPMGEGYGGDVNRDGNPAGSSRLFAVLWDKESDTVWVDANQNRSFADEKPMKEYRVRSDVGVFGMDNPATPNRETVPFIVRSDREKDLVHVIPQGGDHPTMCISVAAGVGFFGGKANGVAPGARVVVVLAHNQETYGLIRGTIEGIILAAKHPLVDVMTIQATPRMRLNDGQSVMSVIFDRVVEKYRKPIFSSAGNNPPAIGAVTEVSSGSKVISVGSHVHRDTFRSLFGVGGGRDNYVHPRFPSGPREDGGFKPDLIAPVATMAVVPGPVCCGTGARGFRDQGMYRHPPRYFTGLGTSLAAPIAAGAVALLVSAARQRGVTFDAERIRWALKSSARFIPNQMAHEQGAGLIDIRAAWEALNRAPELVAITSEAPVRTILSKYLKEPHRGPGIYEREGSKEGDKGERTITFTRTSGSAKPVTYALRWAGNDGTFSGPASVSLPLNRAVELPILVNPRGSGVHSAILNLDEVNGARSIYQVMNTVVAAEQFDAAADHTASWVGEVEYPGKSSCFFNIPEGTQTVQFKMKIEKGSLNPRLMSPAGNEPLFSSSYLAGEWNQTITNPEAGVWQLVVLNALGTDPFSTKEARRSPEEGRAAFALTATLVGIELQAQDAARTGMRDAATREVTLTNRYGDFEGIVTTSLGSAFSDRPTLMAGGAPQVYEINVPAGTERLKAQIMESSDTGADVDVYLFDCTRGDCRTLFQGYNKAGISDGTQEEVTIIYPKPGKWKVVIDPVSLPSGQSTVDYLDVFTHPAFGLAQSAEVPALRGSGAKWTGKVRIAATEAVPAKKRYLAEVIEVCGKEPAIVRYTFNEVSRTQDPVRKHVAVKTIVAAR